MTFDFMKKGKAAHEQVVKADLETEARKAAGSVWRFRMPQDTEAQITFLDGVLGDEGLLDTVTYWEHQVRLNGKWGNFFPCTQEFEPCPLCEKGETSALVALFTIIDHRKWEDKNGKAHQHEKRLFACKRDTFKRLQHLATKREGLAGITFDVQRIGDKSAAVGTDFDFVEKNPLAKVKSKYSLEDVKAIDYSEVVKYYTAEELRELGFGDGNVAIGAAQQAEKTDYAKDL